MPGAYLPILPPPQARRCLVLLAAAVLAVRGWKRVEITGDSMRPLLAPGDRVLVRRFGGLRRGDVVALRDPRSGHLIIKRIQTRTPAGRFEVLGDNRKHSTDSRHFGPIDHSAVVGRVVYRYAPPGRAGALRRPNALVTPGNGH